MSLRVEYESEYYFFQDQEFTITPTFIQGNPTSFIINVKDLTIDQNTGVISGKISNKVISEIITYKIVIRITNDIGEWYIFEFNLNIITVDITDYVNITDYNNTYNIPINNTKLYTLFNIKFSDKNPTTATLSEPSKQLNNLNLNYSNSYIQIQDSCNEFGSCSYVCNAVHLLKPSPNPSQTRLLEHP